ncbi:MAG TPA: S53 family peptidase [Acidimicrobiales bacterium]|jgi:subtilase family serine protease|nr:S53 family peptidase [Acidimicrobiales bacterium]
MNIRHSLVAGASGVALVASLAWPAAATATPARVTHHNVAVCAKPTSGSAGCDAVLNEVQVNGKPASPATTPSGYGPSALRSAYALASAAASSGGGQTVAIVDAYNDPKAAADLATYRSTFGIPACTVASGCFTQMSQTGSTTSLPRNNGSWSEEISLDLDMVSAICPNCHILLVEASSASIANLAAAAREAAARGATEVSNSYGGSESSTQTSYDSSYNHAGVAVTASAGDSGYGVSFPASSPYVTAVGGTSLVTSNTTRGWTETAWSGTGSGCSTVEAKPSWQSDTGCARRTVGDVSADADPNTGVAVYDSYSYQGYSGWLVFGGTSVASPIIASVYALAGNASSVGTGAQHVYAEAGSLNDVTSGSNGTCSSSAAYLCTAGPGYDGPTGLGTPAGTTAF